MSRKEYAEAEDINPRGPQDGPTFVTLDFGKSNAQVIDSNGDFAGNDSQKVTLEYQARTLTETERTAVKDIFDGFDDEITELAIGRVYETLNLASLMQIIKRAQQ